MNKFTVISKIIGATAAGVLLFDAGSFAVRNSKKESKRSLANRLPDQYVSSMRLDNPSATTNKLKKGLFKWNLDNPLPEFFAGIGGSFSGFFGSLSQNVIPAALATGALLFNKVGRVCGVGLAVFGIKYLFSDVLNIGKKGIIKDDL